MKVSSINHASRPALLMLGAVSTISLIAVGVLAVNGNITSLGTIGSLHLLCGVTATVTFLSLVYLSKGGNPKKWIVNALLVATLIIVGMVGISTLKGGYGMQFIDPLAVTSGKAALMIGSGLALIGSVAVKVSN